MFYEICPKRGTSVEPSSGTIMKKQKLPLAEPEMATNKINFISFSKDIILGFEDNNKLGSCAI